MGDTYWFLNTKVTHHFTPNLNNMMIHNQFAGDDKVIVDKGLSIVNIGKFSFNYSSGSLIFNDFLYVPSILINLISVQHFYLDNGTFIEFYPSHFAVKDQKTRLVLLQRKL